MSSFQLNPYVRFALDEHLPPTWRLSPRVLFDYEIMYLKSGELEVCIEGEKHQGLPGDVFLFKPNQLHSITSKKNLPINQPHVHFDPIKYRLSPYVYINFCKKDKIPEKDLGLFRKDILSHIFPNLKSHFRPADPRIIEVLMSCIISEYNTRMIHSQMSMQGLFIQLFANLLRQNHWQNSKTPNITLNIACQVKNYLDSNIHREVSLDEISKHIHLSKYHLCRQFKDTFGTSPIAYHMQSRINRAKELLVTSRIPINDIASNLGFSSVSSFSRAFKANAKISPSTYRK